VTKVFIILGWLQTCRWHSYSKRCH